MKRSKGELLSNTQNVKNSKFIDGNTLSIEYQDGTKAIRLHNTDIVTITSIKDNKNSSIKDNVNSDNTSGLVYTLNSGGWRTPTTKDRINKYSPARISQVKGVWYIDSKTFFDGIQINERGNVISKEFASVDLNEVEAMKKKISKFVNLITKDNLPLPNNGDCWDCAIFKDENGKKVSLLDHNHSHLLMHIEESYIHGTLLVNAMRENGQSDQSIGICYRMKLHLHFKQALRKYLQRRLIPDIAIR